ncbi:hypothetical protein SUGI_0913730 [Cryptomeria japonica]|nr:hypothetical protein SUGI_0913730 [Cryptomeria japonica]
MRIHDMHVLKGSGTHKSKVRGKLRPERGQVKAATVVSLIRKITRVLYIGKEMFVQVSLEDPETLQISMQENAQISRKGLKIKTLELPFLQDVGHSYKQQSQHQEQLKMQLIPQSIKWLIRLVT